MKQAKRRGVGAVLALAAAALIGLLSVRAVYSMQDKQKVVTMTERMKTICVGRFLIDLPENAEVTFSSARVNGFRISTAINDTDEKFAARLSAREREIAAQTNQRGKKSLEQAKPFVSAGLAGKLLVFGREFTRFTEHGKIVNIEDVTIEAHTRAKGLSFFYKAEGMAPESVAWLTRLVRQLRPLAENEIPSEPGFCLNRAIVRDPVNSSDTEAVTMFAGMPGHPDLSIVLSSMAGTNRGLGMLARNAAASERESFLVRAGFTTLREGARTINGLQGEELAMRVREPNFTTGFTFDWEMSGKQDDIFRPLLTLELETGRNPQPGGKPVQSSLSEDALINLWVRISSSIRVRPTRAPKTVSAEPPVPPLGTYASAGDHCPESGWWLCSEGGNGIGVLGGQRQYLRKGQRMPQALLLPPQTLWQKVRGLQPSYESERPTAWKLVDKRNRERTEPPVALAPAVSVARADAATPAAGAPPSDSARADVGSYVKTGIPCPASGWWRCEESHALDGTRWFAQGSLLPAATFKVPPGAFGKSSGPEVIQRRSAWQLVRYAPAASPDHAPFAHGDPGTPAGNSSLGPPPDPAV